MCSFLFVVRLLGVLAACQVQLADRGRAVAGAAGAVQGGGTPPWEWVPPPLLLPPDPTDADHQRQRPGKHAPFDHIGQAVNHNRWRRHLRASARSSPAKLESSQGGRRAARIQGESCDPSTLHRAGSVTQKNTGWISPEAAASAREENDEEEVSESVGGVEF